MKPEHLSEDRSSAAVSPPEAPTLVGDSDALHRVREEIRSLADFDEPVLVVGETGVGKELVARALHVRSRRGDRPLEVVNCGGLTGELLAAELFGHRAGAFTGARRDRPGRI
ncbi:MAG: sigma 54-interacting transcriptional regulator, partial [Acidobacteriota bacterium]